METKQIESGNQAFTTTDAELALSLITAGCRFAGPESGGPAQMHYTPDICRNRWVTTKNLNGDKIRVQLLPSKPVSPVEFELSVMRAARLKIPGVITWFIVRDEVFQEAIATHDALAQEAQDAEMQKRPMNIPTLTAAQVMAACYARRMNDKQMNSYAWVRSPNLVLGDVKKTVTPKEGVPGEVLEQMNYTMSGTGTIWSLDLSDEHRAQRMSDGKPFIHPKPKLP